MNRLACGFELKLASDGSDAMTFEGYGAVFGNVDSYGDVIEPGAFADTLRAAKSTGQWPAMLAQHGSMLGGADDMPIGIWTELEEDTVGLRAKGMLADTERGREAYALLKMPRPALNGLSIGYLAKEWSMRTKPDEPRRTLKKVELLEVSLVTFPANPRARVTGVKAAAEQIETIRDFETFLRDAGGFSREAAKAIASRGFKGSAEPRDADDVAELVRLAKARGAALSNLRQG